ncbi:uncharacterized protein MELLADRAFT_89366 [Melampsora larici-populina 98AG31]|uniref:Tet-like 2OG-Fe(II) oxygenase domain-containing protein n=1 Tax=Melampsora larici-populina (strain 98AG31 / pathotype 3-4-7) TaxID=747676 RepID=F4R5X3_MELLP|nr:uncharacterized protein MELLADRAFT_89366 [Melampsora larici-populina 98AG31]EGG12113.1 hypothetical protein MELLADRAFT_89366 [Melampsora larici-populina 98AG31]
MKSHPTSVDKAPFTNTNFSPLDASKPLNFLLSKHQPVCRLNNLHTLGSNFLFSKLQIVAVVQDQHGTPSTAKVIRCDPNRQVVRTIESGHVVLVDSLTGEFIASIYTLHEDDDSNKHLREKFDWAVQILYHHGLARNKCEVNKAQKALGDAKSGEMYPTGSRGGTDKGKSGGPYVLNAQTLSKPQLIKQDIERMKLMPSVDKFISQLFAYLVLSQFKANLELAQQYGVSWASTTFFNTLDKSSCGSNLVITRDEFANESHQDPDASGCAIGLFCLMERDTGKVIHPQETSAPPPFHIEEAYFYLDNYNTRIRLSHRAKVIVWNTKMHHHSSLSQTLDSFGKVVSPRKANLTNFGSSIQVSQTIVDRIRGMRKKQAGMSEKKWNAFKIKRVNDYADEINKRLTDLKEIKKLDPLIEAQIKASLDSLGRL